MAIGNSDVVSLYVSYVDGAGGKSRPVLVIGYKNRVVNTYRLTTKFSKKSQFIKEQYYELKSWEKAGLKQKSWVDLGEIFQFQLDKINYKKIGKISMRDFMQLKKQLIRVAERRAIFKFRSLLSKRIAKSMEVYLEDKQIPIELISFNHLSSILIDEQVELSATDLVNVIATKGELSNDKVNTIIKEFIQENYDNDYLNYKYDEKINSESLKNDVVETLVNQLIITPRYRDVEHAYWSYKLHMVQSTKELYKYAQNEDLEGLTTTYVPEWEEMKKGI